MQPNTSSPRAAWATALSGSASARGASVSAGDSAATYTYNWSVSAGTITSGQGTSSITVDTAGSGGQSVTATVSIGGADPSCTGTTASCTTSIKPPPQQPTKFDEYGNIRFNDEKARLDNFAISLQGEPTSQGYIVAYGTCDEEGQKRAQRAKDYLVNTRGIDAGRIMIVDGGCMPELKVELWIVPQGATVASIAHKLQTTQAEKCRRRHGHAMRPRRAQGGVFHACH